MGALDGDPAALVDRLLPEIRQFADDEPAARGTTKPPDEAGGGAGAVIRRRGLPVVEVGLGAGA
jgi:hypothetical protein